MLRNFKRDWMVNMNELIFEKYNKLKAERDKIKEICDGYFDEFEMCCLDLPDAIDSLLKRYDNAFVRLKKVKESEGNL